MTAMRKRKEESPLRPTPSFDAELSPAVLDFFAARGIGAATLSRNRVAQETLGDGSTAIAFPYYRWVGAWLVAMAAAVAVVAVPAARSLTVINRCC